jgi:hypothetical protein
MSVVVGVNCNLLPVGVNLRSIQCRYDVLILFPVTETCDSLKHMLVC